MPRYVLWIICVVWMCFFTYSLIEIVDRQDQESKERYERQRAFVKVKFEVPPGYQLFIDGTQHNGIVYMCSLNTFTLEWRKDGVVVKSVEFKPKGPHELNTMEVVKP